MRLLLSYPTTRALIKSALSALLLKAQVHCLGSRLLWEQTEWLPSSPEFTEMDTLASAALPVPHTVWKVRWFLLHRWQKLRLHVQFSSVQSLSHVQLFVTPWTTACQVFLSITNSQSLFKLMSIELVTPSNHLTLCRPLLLLPLIFPSIRVFSKESVLRIRWPKYWSFSFSLSPSNEYSGLISFRMDWLDLLAVQGTLKSLLQHHSSKASVLRRSAFFIVQLSHPYMMTGKTTSLTRWTFIGQVMSLLFNLLSRLVIAFLPRSKCLNFLAVITICSDFGAHIQ